MTYPETLYFIGKCLTLGTHPWKIASVQDDIQTGKVDWEKVVYVSSSHLVLPALYLQLERATLLKHLPEELTEYLRYLTEENRERNRLILQQVQDISVLLNRNGIKPVFLKGVACLLINLYEDDAERMLGDIDVLVEESKVLRTAELLIAEGYKTVVEYNNYIHDEQKHYPRLMHGNYPSAVEVHREVLLRPYSKHFRGEDMVRNARNIGKDIQVFVPSMKDLIIHNVLNVQFNDRAYLNRMLNLRQMYDSLHLSKRTDVSMVLAEFGKYKKPTNAWFELTAQLLGAPEILCRGGIHRSSFYLMQIDFFLNHPAIHTVFQKIVFLVKRLQRYIAVLARSVVDKKIRRGLWIRLSNPGWYVNHIKTYRILFRLDR